MRVKTPVFLQNEAAECGAVALQIVLAYYGRIVPSAEIRHVCGVSRDGVRGDHLVQAARHYRLNGRSFRKSPASLRDLKPPFIAFMSFNHFVVVEGFAGEAVSINDPASGRRTLPTALFDRQFTGIVFTFEPTPEFKQQGRRTTLITRLRPYSPGVLSLTLLGMAAALAVLPSLAYPALLRSFLDDVLLNSAVVFIPLIAIGGLVLGFCFVITVLQQYLVRRLESQLTVTHAARLMWHLLRLPDSFFTQRSHGDLAARFVHIDSLSHFFSREMMRLAAAFLLIAAYLFVLSLYHPLLPLLSMVLIAIYALTSTGINRQMHESAAVWQSKLRRLVGTAVQSLQHIEQIKANGAEADVFTRLVTYYTDMQQASQSLSVSVRLLNTILLSLTALNTTIMILVGIAQVQNGLWSVSVFMAVYVVSISLWAAMTGLLGLSGRTAQIRTEINRLEDVLHEPPRTLPDPTDSGDGFGVEVRDLVFGYKRLDRPLLTIDSLRLLPGQTVGLVGASGSGKTTLARLIAGSYTPQQGTIQRGRVGLVDQDVVLFQGTVWDNITLWDDSLSREVVEQASQDAEIHAEIQRLPQQYNTLLTEQGRTLSGGQRQRIQLARTLASDPTLVILDEATSALDPLLEEKVLHNIQKRGSTVLIISHRWSAIRDCDEIWVMENGQIVGRGTHETLWQKNDAYTRLLHVPPTTITDLSTMAEESAVSPPRVRTSRSLHTAIKQLTSLITEPTESMWDELSGQSPEIDACTLIGREVGFTVYPPLTPQTDQILATAAASHVYVRRVLLPPQWWRQDCGPFISQCHGETAAFLWREQRYWAALPATRRLLPINAHTAVDVENTVYQFYSPLPPLPLSLSGLVWRAVSANRSDLRLLIVCGATAALLPVIPSLLVGQLFETILPLSQSSMVGQVILALLGSAALSALFGFFQASIVIRIQTRTDFVLQSGVWTHLLSLPPSFFRQWSAGDLVQRVIGSRETLQTLTLTLINGLFYGLSCAASGLVLAAVAPSVAVVNGLLTLIYLGVLAVIGRAFLAAERTAAEQQGHSVGWMTGILQGITHLQMAHAVERVFSVWVERFSRLHRPRQQACIYESRLQVMNSVYPLVALLALFLSIMANGEYTVGTFITTQVLMLSSAVALTQFGSATLTLLRLIPLSQRLTPILTAVPETHPGQQAAQPLRGQITVHNVTFRYQAASQPALRSLSLRIELGEFVAVVGASGSGKSTLLRILLGFETPETGTVMYDQQLLADVDPRTIRAQIGTVLQQHNLIYGSSLFQNLAGARQITLDKAWAALRFAGLEADVAALPMGIHTLLTEGGKALSAGQRQRLLIARAVVHRPRLLFFDEATSALDDQTQALLIRHLSTLNITRLVVAHRLSTVQQADRILVMDQGQIVESGSYETLIAQGGVFAQFAQRQQLL